MRFTGAGGTVYYTTDGSDPRLPGGNVSSAASTSQPITINATTIVTARARSGTGLTSWSGPLRGTFLLGPIADASNFAITEVHYAPLPPSSPAESAAATDASDFEFVEMMNTSTTDTIDLTDVHYEAGIEFTFTGSAITSLAPGERVLIVSNQAAFEARYGPVHNDRIAGEFAPTRLDNAGERLHLVDALGITIADFTYNDKFPWPSEAGFAGYSMVLKAGALPNPDYTNPSNWRSSGYLGGNPDSTDSTPLAGSPSADDDQDQVEKLLEHAFGTSDSDPTDAGHFLWVSIQDLEINDVTDPYLTLTFRRNLTADDVVLTPEVTWDLGSWLRGEPHLLYLSEDNQGDGTSLVTYRTASPYDHTTQFRGFFRVEVSMP